MVGLLMVVIVAVRPVEVCFMNEGPCSQVVVVVVAVVNRLAE